MGGGSGSTSQKDTYAFHQYTCASCQPVAEKTLKMIASFSNVISFFNLVAYLVLRDLSITYVRSLHLQSTLTIYSLQFTIYSLQSERSSYTARKIYIYNLDEYLHEISLKRIFKTQIEANC